MPRIRPPHSDSGYAYLLGTSLKTAISDSSKGLVYLPAALCDEIGAFLIDRQEGDRTVPGFASLVTLRTADEGRVTKDGRVAGRRG